MSSTASTARYLPSHEVGEVTGAVVAIDVDRFDFAMEVTRTADGLRLERVDPT